MIESVEMIIRQTGHPDRVVRLQEGATRLGRSEECEIVLSDVGVSRRHARLLLARDEVAVEDLGSGNGTYYRGRRVERQALHDGDEVIIDPFVLEFRIRGDAQPPQDDPTLDGPLARLDVVHGPGLARNSYGIPAGGLTLGRSETRDIVVPDPASSRHQCSIFFQDGQYVLRDMGSANGTFVNDYRVKESILTDGDRVQIGNTELRFVLDDATKAGGIETPPSHGALSPRERRPRPSAARGSASGELSLPAPERGGFGGWVSMALGGATLLTFMALVMVVSGALLYVVLWNTGAPETVTVPSGPPEVAVQGSEALQGNASPEELFEMGVEALRAGEHGRALEALHASLTLRPDDPYAERFLFVASEYLVFGMLQREFQARSRARAARERRRAELMEEAQRPGRRGRLAVDDLAREFRNDALVIDTMGWGPSARTRDLQGRVGEAGILVTQENWADAVAIYDEVVEDAEDAALRQTARGGLKLARRERARAAAEDWRAAVVAEAEGDVEGARQGYDRVLAIDPHNPSAQLRRQRLDAE